jgi:tetratricopeptide (TPR) repeat protein
MSKKYLIRIVSCINAGAILLSLGSCHHADDTLEPKINYAVQDKYLKSLPSPFPPLTLTERGEDWGKEYLIGLSFARELDLYQAITAFKRAEFLAPPEVKERKLEIEYEILLSYYLGRKYHEVVYTFENSDLRFIDDKFPAKRDMLIILYDSYEQTGEVDKAASILQILQQFDQKTPPQLVFSSALQRADFPVLKEIEKEPDSPPYLHELLTNYEINKKSVGTAQALNATLPGAGYFYLGQTQTGITALLVNGLFIAAAVNFFIHGHTAAGIITTSFEAGWYFGGIYGAREETKFYNERLYESYATPMMNQKGLFPVLMLQFAF